MLPSRDEAVEIARQYLAARGVRTDMPLVNAALRDEADPINQRDEVALALGLSAEADIDAAMRQLGAGSTHWLIAFRIPDPPGTASTIPATVVLVYSRHEVTM